MSGSLRIRRRNARRRSTVAHSLLRRHTRALFLLGMCAEMGWPGTAISLVEHLQRRSEEAEEEFTLMQKELALTVLAGVEEAPRFSDLEFEERVLKFCAEVEEDLKVVTFLFYFLRFLINNDLD